MTDHKISLSFEVTEHLITEGRANGLSFYFLPEFGATTETPSINHAI